MRRIFDAFAYGDGPRRGCWWDETCEMPEGRALTENTQVDVVIIGGGFTGVSAALRLAEAGLSVAVLEARQLGWGASGRNGGFCCLGGGRAEDRELDARFGKDARLAFRRTEVAAVQFVADRIAALKLEVDRHSQGETTLAHRLKDMRTLDQHAEAVVENYGVSPQLLPRSELSSQGFGGGPFYGALTTPVGFGLNPRKLLAGLVYAAQIAGVAFFEDCTVQRVERQGGRYCLRCGAVSVHAEQFIVATNGYSSDNVPEWLAARYMPAQSTVLVTRPLTDQEIEAQGWATDQMSYDTRNLLHYFRLMPDRRFLFGMRGGLRTGAAAEAAARRRTRKDFQRMFPAWAHVESAHSWSGFVSLARDKLPFVGGIPDMPGAWAAMCYHGNGVAMGSYCGKLIADRVLGAAPEDCPIALRSPLKTFPLGPARRLLMAPAYMAMTLADRH